jgi:hypothetical protein
LAQQQVNQMAIKINKKADFAVQNDSYSPRKEGDRRLGIDRRWFNYAVHLPERRSQAERRSGKDRRLIVGLATEYALWAD